MVVDWAGLGDDCRSFGGQVAGFGGVAFVITAPGFPPRIKYGVTFFRGVAFFYGVTFFRGSDGINGNAWIPAFAGMAEKRI